MLPTNRYNILSNLTSMFSLEVSNESLNDLINIIYTKVGAYRNLEKLDIYYTSDRFVIGALLIFFLNHTHKPDVFKYKIFVDYIKQMSMQDKKDLNTQAKHIYKLLPKNTYKKLKLLS